ncbi:MAG: methyltransferase, partial [Bdellovibrionales bacterium]
DFRELKLPPLKGSFRLKVSPQNRRGAWLDFSNLDIQALLQNSEWMTALTDLSIVEMGQKHKIVGRKKTGDWGLFSPEFFEWNESLYQGKIIPLASTVASFSQPSHTSNHWIVSQIYQMIAEIKPHHILEFGSGFGNLSFPALYNNQVHLTCLEYAPLSTAALKHNFDKYKIQNQVTIHQGDFRKKMTDWQDYDFLLLNPARNGVGSLFDSFLDDLKKIKKPASVLYMSCYPETLFLDSQKLKQQGYRLTQLKIADQFPQTEHMEVISLWQR